MGQNLLNIQLIIINGIYYEYLCFTVYYLFKLCFSLCCLWEDDYVKKWYWKVLIGGGILALTFAAIMGY
jgi:hypothetical protein